jgi:hypothetical protein
MRIVARSEYPNVGGTPEHLKLASLPPRRQRTFPQTPQIDLCGVTAGLGLFCRAGHRA